MSGAIMGVVMVKGELRQLPKWGLSLEELEHAFGLPDLVKSLRRIGALVPAKRYGRTMVFDTGDAAVVWVKYVAGDYDKALKELGKI